MSSIWPPDNPNVQFGTPKRVLQRHSTVPWALEIKAVSTVEPSQLVRMATGAILGCDGWILTRSMSDSGRVTILFEFERHACVEIYTVLIASGIELSHSGHLRMTELCQCTRNQFTACGAEIASIEIEIQTNPSKIAASPASGEGMSGGVR
ncbi:MAG TPA: hypothetical protein VF742_12280 [Terracidiphilus sp.]|jgi:hypothetical protein